MLIRFSVVSFVDRQARIGITGSVPELGSWDAKSIIPLLPYHINANNMEPSMWSVAIEIDISNLSSIEYKFTTWNEDNLLPITHHTVTRHNETEIPEPLCGTQKMSRPGTNAEIIWEGSSSNDNRRILFTAPKEVINYDNLRSLEHYFNKSNNLVLNGEYVLPTYIFNRSIQDRNQELDLITKSYLRLKNQREIHYNRILNRLLVGTAPLKKEHLEKLMKEESVSDIMTLQTIDDIKENNPLETGKTSAEISIELVSQFYEQIGLKFTHYAMEDMDTQARARGTAQAVVLLASLMKRPDCTGVYVHCNGGIGRSVATVCGYMINILNLPFRLTNFIVSARRPVAYFDEAALRIAKKEFDSKYSGVAKFLKKQIESTTEEPPAL